MLCQFSQYKYNTHTHRGVRELTSADFPTPPDPKTTSLYSRILTVCLLDRRHRDTVWVRPSANHRAALVKDLPALKTHLKQEKYCLHTRGNNYPACITTKVMWSDSWWGRHRCGTLPGYRCSESVCVCVCAWVLLISVNEGLLGLPWWQLYVICVVQQVVRGPNINILL